MSNNLPLILLLALDLHHAVHVPKLHEPETPERLGDDVSELPPGLDELDDALSFRGALLDAVSGSPPPLGKTVPITSSITFRHSASRSATAKVAGSSAAPEGLPCPSEAENGCAFSKGDLICRPPADPPDPWEVSWLHRLQKESQSLHAEVGASRPTPLRLLTLLRLE